MRLQSQVASLAASQQVQPIIGRLVSVQVVDSQRVAIFRVVGVAAVFTMKLSLCLYERRELPPLSDVAAFGSDDHALLPLYTEA
jgi:hypothetical protein